MPSSLKTASNLSIIHIRHHSSPLIHPAHTLPELPPHRTRRIQPLPLTQPKKPGQQKTPAATHTPQPHNSYQLCSRPLQNTYEKVYSSHTPPSIRYSASPPSTQPSGTPSSPNTNTRDPKTPAHTTPKVQTTETPAAAQPPPQIPGTAPKP